MQCNPRRAVAVQAVYLKGKFWNRFFHLIGARVETTWVPGAFQLWVRGSQRAPPRLAMVAGGSFLRAAAAASVSAPPRSGTSCI
jgi:hypothetical protein